MAALSGQKLSADAGNSASRARLGFAAALRHQRGHSLDPIPDVLDPDVLVIAVLIVVVIGGRNDNGG